MDSFFCNLNFPTRLTETKLRRNVIFSLRPRVPRNIAQKFSRSSYINKFMWNFMKSTWNFLKHTSKSYYIQDVPRGYVRCDVSRVNAYNRFRFFVRFAGLRCTVHILHKLKCYCERLKKLSFRFTLFEKFKDSNFIKSIVLIILTVRLFISINFMILNNCKELKKCCI